jgi:hypothetical protein
MSNLYILQDDGLRKLNSDLTVAAFLPISNCRYAVIDSNNIYVYANNFLKKIDLQTFSVVLSHSGPLADASSPKVPMASDSDNLYITSIESGNYTIRKISKETLVQSTSISLGSLSQTYGIVAKDNICYSVKREYSGTSLVNDTAEILKTDFTTVSHINLPFFGSDPVLSEDGTNDSNDQRINCTHDLQIPLFIFNNKLYVGYYSTKSYTRINQNTTFGRVEDLNSYLLPLNLDSNAPLTQILMPANFNQSFNYDWSGLDPDTWPHNGIMNLGPAAGNTNTLYLTAFGDNVSSGNNPTNTQHLYVGKYNLSTASKSSITLSANSGTQILSIAVDPDAGILYIGTDGESDDYSSDEVNNLIKISLSNFSVVSYTKISSTASSSYSQNASKNAILSILSDSTINVSSSDSLELDISGIQVIHSDLQMEDLAGTSTEFLPDKQIELNTLTGDAKVFKNYSREKSNYLDIQIHIR